MKVFEKNFEEVVEDGPHPDFRCFISSEPPGLPLMEIIPEAVLQNSLKVANEAPTDLKSNIRRAFNRFDEGHFERSKSHKHTEFKACYSDFACTMLSSWEERSSDLKVGLERTPSTMVT